LNYGTDIPNYSTQFVQYVADNVDHNIKTLDGNNTFHGMGMIAAVTPGTKASSPISRVKVNSDEIASVGRVPILYCKENAVGMTTVRYQKFRSFAAKDLTAQLDLL